MKKQTVHFLAGFWIVTAALAAAASPTLAESLLNPVQNTAAGSSVSQGPIVMGRSVALRHKTKLHHVKVKPAAAVTASNVESEADAK